MVGRQITQIGQGTLRMLHSSHLGLDLEEREKARTQTKMPVPAEANHNKSKAHSTCEKHRGVKLSHLPLNMAPK